MRVSLFTSERDNAPRTHELTFDELAQDLATARASPCTPGDCVGSKCPHKLGRGWSPATFIGTRSKKNVDHVHALVVDVDHVTDADIAALVPRLEPFRYIVHTSHSDRIGDRCLRVVIELDTPVAAVDWPRFWSTVMSALGLPADPSTCDASRLYFLPSRPTGADYFSAVHPGAPLSVAGTLAAAPARPEPTQTAPATAERPQAALGALAAELEKVGDLPRTQANAAALLASVWPDRGRHYASLALAGALARAGWDEERIAEFLTAIAAAVNGDDGEPGKRAAQARDSVAKVEAGEDVAGWPTLIDKHGLPRQNVAEACRWLGVPFDTSPDVDDVLDAIAGCLQPDAEPGQAGERLASWVSELAELVAAPIRCYSTGIEQLDRLLGGGLWSRRLAVLVGPPADGKSALGISLALYVSKTIVVLYVSTELESDELAARFAANLIDVPWRELLNDRDRKRAALVNVRVRVIGCEKLSRDGAVTMRIIAAEVQAITAEEGTPPLLMVDYLQDLVRGVAEKDARARVGDFATAFRALSQHLDCPVLVISSVSRAYYGAAKAAQLRQQDHAEAYMSAAKESGDVDYAAAMIMFLDVEPKEDGQAHRVARIAVAKSRLGEAGFAGMQFFGASGRWIASPESLVLLSPEMQKRRAEDKAFNEDRERILGVVREYPGMLNKTQLKARAGGNATRVGNAIDRMEGKELVLVGDRYDLAKSDKSVG